MRVAFCIIHQEGEARMLCFTQRHSLLLSYYIYIYRLCVLLLAVCCLLAWVHSSPGARVRRLCFGLVAKWACVWPRVLPFVKGLCLCCCCCCFLQTGKLVLSVVFWLRIIVLLVWVNYSPGCLLGTLCLG